VVRRHQGRQDPCATFKRTRRGQCQTRECVITTLTGDAR
jgi:hypothetical protein